MNNSAMANMGTFLQYHRHTRKHVDGTIFLDITTVSDDDLAPVAADGCPGRDVDIFADDHVAGYGRLWMYECTFAHNWFISVKFVNHFFLLVNGYLFSLPEYITQVPLLMKERSEERRVGRECE